MGTLRQKDGYYEFTEANIQRTLARQFMSSPEYILFNFYVFNWESDFLVKTHAGYWHEVEIKISVADFKNEFTHKKDKYKVLTEGTMTTVCGRSWWDDKRHYQGGWEDFEVPAARPNFFSYCVTSEIIDKVKDLVPENFGLYWVDEHGGLHCHHVAKRLHSNKLVDSDLDLMRKFYFNYRNMRNNLDSVIFDAKCTNRYYQEQIAKLEATIKELKGKDNG